MYTEEDISNTLLEKIYSIVNAADVHTGIQTQNRIISICMPGIPYSEKALDFGFATMNKDQIELAADFAGLVDIIPNWGSSWSASGRDLSKEYTKCVYQPRLPSKTFTDSEAKRYEEALDFLWTTEKRLDSKTGKWIEVKVESLAFERYNEYATKYNNAKAAYANAYKQYLAHQTEPGQDLLWADEKLLLTQINDRALAAWEQAGKGKVEEEQAVIANIERKGLSKIWNDRFHKVSEEYKQASLLKGSFLHTKYIPQKFWSESAGWNKVTMSHNEVHTFNKSETVNWGGGGSGGWGLWSFSGSADYKSKKTFTKADLNNLEITFELATIPILRGWLDGDVFSSRSWDLDRGLYSPSENLSDGGMPPTGTMVMYPTSILFVRNLRINFDRSSTNDTYAMDQISGSASGGWGPFSFKANYFSETITTTHDFVADAAGVSVAGMQIIGFGCTVIPKSPNPDPTLNW